MTKTFTLKTSDNGAFFRELFKISKFRVWGIYFEFESLTELAEWAKISN